MIADLKPYPEYMESGVPWLGQVPGHWRVQRLRQVADMLVSNVDKHTHSHESPVRLCNYVDVYKNERITGKIRFMRATATSDEIQCFRVQLGDVIITKDSEVWTDIGVPSLAEYTAPDLVCGYHLAILRSRKGVLVGTYLLRALQSQGVATQFHVSAHGVTRYGLSHDGMKSVVVPIPPPDEQDAIVSFLDYANTRLEKSIRAKRKLITLLNEQKQAIIHRAVTRGLDTNVRFKDSGIGWLGEIPAHWNCIPIKRLLSQIDYGTSEATRSTGRIRLLTMGNIQDGEVIIPESGGIDSIPENLLLEHNDLLFTRTNGNPNLVGKVGIFRGNIIDKISFASYLVRLRVRKPNNPCWLHMILNSQSFWPFARSHALVNLQTNLNATRYSQFMLPVPPPSEQNDLVKWINQESEQIICIINHTKQEIELLREYRTRLIADVVTGKLDVRDIASDLPDEKDKLEDLANPGIIIYDDEVEFVSDISAE